MDKIKNYNLPEHTNKLYMDESISSIGLTHEIAAKVNELVDAYNKMKSSDLEWKQTQEGKINKGVLYMKDNLINSLRELFDVLEKSDTFTGIYGEQLGEVSKLLNQLNVYVTPEMFGAKGDGITDDTKSFAKALSSGKPILLSGSTYLLDEIILPEQDIEIVGFKAVIIAKNKGIVFKRDKRGYLTELSGITLKGDGVLFYYDSGEGAQPNQGQQLELIMKNCKFFGDTTDKHPIYLYGTRETIIDGCYFINTAGVYCEFTINTVISNCEFKNSNYIVLSKLGSEGLICSNLVALGCLYGICCERTTGVQVVNSMIDYCDNPVYFKGATDVMLSNNYITSRTKNPAIYINDYNGFSGYRYHIVNNDLKTNGDSSTCVISIANAYHVKVSCNVIANFTTNAIEYYEGFILSEINHNTITARSGNDSGYSIINKSTYDDSTVRIKENYVDLPISKHITSSGLTNNAGFLTTASGEAIIQTGTSSVTVTHGLKITPVKHKFMLTPTTPTLGNIAYYVSAITPTTFTISLSSAVSSTTGIAWYYNN